MKKAYLLVALPVLLAASLGSCDRSSVSASNAAHSARRESAPAEKALAAVSTVHAHRAIEYSGTRVVYHPSWSSRIDVADAGGEWREVYRRTWADRGPYPREVVLGFRDVALAVFDPNHRIHAITAETLDGQTWSFANEKARCLGACSPAIGADPTAARSLLPAAAPLESARLALPPTERARASVSTGAEHRVAEAAGERASYHPGWSSRIRKMDTAGSSREIYRQSRIYYGPYPREVALGFHDVALAVFDPNHRLQAITVETLNGVRWSFQENGQRCPVICDETNEPSDTLP